MAKSAFLAAFLSLIIPGAGLYYLGSDADKVRFLAFFFTTAAGVIILPLLLAWPASVILSYVRAKKLSN